MEICLLLIVIALLFSIRSLIVDKNKHLNNELSKFKNELLIIKNQLIANQSTSKETEPIKTTFQTTHPEEKKDVKPEASPEKPIVIKDSFTPPKPMFVVDASSKEENTTPAADAIISEKPQEEPLIVTPIYHQIEEPVYKQQTQQTKAKKSFIENNPDLEKFIGENLVNKIGIAILVLGIGYFVKFAIDKNWINEIGRVAIGILCGGILIGLAHRLRKEFSAFSSVLVGGGIAVLYFTISLAFHDYHLFSQTLAFAMMVVITSFAVLLAIAYNRIELAVVAIIGGFGSPFFVSTGQGNHIVLFSYLLVLNMGMLSLAYYKKWNLVNIISYVFTILIFGAWLLSKFNYTVHNAFVVLLFGLAFYIIFFAMNIVYNLKNKLPFQALELSLLLSNTFLFFSAGLYLMNSPQLQDFKGIFTIVLALFNLGFAYPLYKRGDTDKNLIFMLIGLVLTFISLAAPIQLKGHYITLFWAAETVLLLWLSQKSGIKLIKQTSILLVGLLLISLLLDWFKIYNDPTIHLIPFANKAFVTGIFTLIALVIKMRLLKPENETSFNMDVFKLKEYQIIIQTLVIVVLYLSLFLEIWHQIVYYYQDNDIRNIVLVAYHFTYVFALHYYLKNQHQAQINSVKIGMLAVCIILLLLSNINVINLRNHILQNNAPFHLFFYLHFYIIALGFYFINLLHKTLKLSVNNNTSNYRLLYWLTVVLWLISASMELDHLVVYTLFNKQFAISYIVNQNHKFGYAILWGISAFILINLGMRRKIREIRIISLALFTLVILKLFIYDIRNISEAGRIAAFVLLGVLLLVVSFMYQRLKKLLASDQDSTINENDEKHEV